MKSIRYDTMLAKAFTNLVKEEFTDKHLSGNLKASTEAHPSCYYSTIVYIKPYAYYQYEFIKNHNLIVYRIEWNEINSEKGSLMNILQAL